MRVLFATYSLAFQNPGGGERVLISLRNGLQTLGVQVELYNPWRHSLADYDLIHYFSCLETSFWNLSKSEAPQVPLIVTPTLWIEAGLRSKMSSLKRQLLGFFQHPSDAHTLSEWARFKKVDYWLPTTNAEAARLTAYRPVDSRKLQVIPNGVEPGFASADPREFRKRLGNEDPFVLHVGRFHPVKNQLKLIRALAGTGLQLVLIGSPDMDRPDYYQACLQEAEKGRVRIFGAIAATDPFLASAYAACSVFALPSDFETFGIAALEAAIAGAPLVLSNKMATRELFEGIADWVDPNDPASIAETIGRAISNPRRPSREKSHELSKRYSWSAISMQVREVYQRILAR